MMTLASVATPRSQSTVCCMAVASGPYSSGSWHAAWAPTNSLWASESTSSSISADAASL